MGFKTRGSPVIRRPHPICVYYKSDNNGEGWCLCKGKPDSNVFSQATQCSRYVTLPGRYEHRFPTCPECIILIGIGKVDPADYPQDLREFLPHD